jgi:hypothetical protein
VLTDAELSLSRELALQAALERASGRTVDLVVLNRASTLTKWQVARDAVSVFERAPHLVARFKASAWTEWFDYAPAFEHALERFKRHLREKSS